MWLFLARALNQTSNHHAVLLRMRRAKSIYLSEYMATYYKRIVELFQVILCDNLSCHATSCDFKDLNRYLMLRDFNHAKNTFTIQHIACTK